MYIQTKQFNEDVEQNHDHRRSNIYTVESMGNSDTSGIV